MESSFLPSEKRDLVLAAFALQGQVPQPAISVEDAARYARQASSLAKFASNSIIMLTVRSAA